MNPRSTTRLRPKRLRAWRCRSDGNTITLTYDEILDTQAGPGTTNFVVTVEGERRDVSRVSVNDRSVELRLGQSGDG